MFSTEDDWKRNPVKADTEETVKSPRIGFWKIALAVLAGNVMTGLLAAFLYSLK